MIDDRTYKYGPLDRLKIRSTTCPICGRRIYVLESEPDRAHCGRKECARAYAITHQQ